MSKPTNNMRDRVKELLFADDVRPESVSPYLVAWTWAESGKTATGLSPKTIQTYEADARRVYRLLDQNRPQ